MTARDRIVVGVIAALAVVAASWMLAIKPKREDAAALAVQTEQAQRRLDSALASLANAKQARAEFSSAQIGIARLGKAVPAEDDPATLVYQLERSARRAGIDFRSVRLEPAPAAAAAAAAPAATGATPAQTPVPAEVEKVPFKLTFEGGFFALRRFVEHAHSFTRMREAKYVTVRGRLLAIEGVTLLAASEGFPKLKAQITATAYSAPAPKLPAAGAAATASTPAAGATPAASTTAGIDTPTSSESPR